MQVNKLIRLLESSIKDPKKGLPEELFLFASRITPIVNVDLLIKNKDGDTLLTWRDDGYWPAGWHIPGGIVRYKENFSDRINAVAKIELGTKVKFSRTPLAINEVIGPKMKNRGHFISFLFQCTLTSPPDKNIRHNAGAPKSGEWAWHAKPPKNLIPIHKVYREFI